MSLRNFAQLFGLLAVFALVFVSCSCGDDDDDNDAASDDDTTDDTTGDDDGSDVIPTTLDVTFIPQKNPDTGEWEMAQGPGEPHAVRNDLSVSATRDTNGAKPLSIAYFAAITDLHMVDEESPTRLNFFDSKYILDGMFDAAFRPNEDLASHQLNALIRTANRIQSDYGRDFDTFFTLGDNTDNGQTNELELLIDVLDGKGILSGMTGWVRPDSGDLELDADSGLNLGERNFFTQETDADGNNINAFHRDGYPNSNADFETGGLRKSDGSRVPWFLTIGNHDVLNTGNFEPDSFLTFYSLDDYTGDVAHYGFIPGVGSVTQYWKDNPGQSIYIDGGLFGLNIDWRLALQILQAVGMIPDNYALDIDDRFDLDVLQNNTPLNTNDDGVEVVPDPERAFMGLGGLVALANGEGHGFADNNGDSIVDANDGGYYRIDWNDFGDGPEMPLRFLVLNSLDSHLLEGGGIEEAQFAWIEQELAQAVTDKVLVVVTSHHPADDIDTGGEHLVELLSACPNVILHLVGHGHDAKIKPYQASAESGGAGYWEVETPSDVIFPQEGRIIEIVDNRDGTGSIFLTLFDHWNTVGDDPDVLSDLGRELAFADVLSGGYDGGVFGGMGTASDRNRELLFQIPSSVANKLAEIETDNPVTSVESLGTLY